MTGKFIYEHTTYALSVGFSGTPNWIPSTTTVTNCIDVYFIVVLISCAGNGLCCSEWSLDEVVNTGPESMNCENLLALLCIHSFPRRVLPLLMPDGGVLQLQNARQRFATDCNKVALKESGAGSYVAELSHFDALIMAP